MAVPPAMLPGSARPLALGAIVLLVAGACGGGRAGVERDPITAPALWVPPPSRLDSVFILESSGVPVDDTLVTMSPAEERVIILRRGAPDNSLFAELTILAAGPSSSGASPRDSLRLTIRPRPGLYAIDLLADGPLPTARLTFSYGVHFVAPPGARERYGSDLAFERFLSVARVEPDGRVVFLPTTRPGSDLVSATLPGLGRFVVAAPRE